MTFAEDGFALARVRRAGDGRPQLLSCEFINSGGDRAHALDETVARLNAAGAHSTTLMDNGDYQLMLVEAPDVQPDELRAAIRWRIKDLIDFHIDDAVIDVFEIPGQGRGRSRMMYVVAARTNKVKQRIADVEDAELDLQAVDVEELALRNLATLSPDDARGNALLWLAPTYGLIVVTRGGELYLSRRIETGANELFTAAQLADPESGDFGAVLGGLIEQITLEIQRSLDYYDSHFSQPPVKSVLVAPTHPESPYLAGALATHLNVPVLPLELDAMFPDTALPAAPVQARCLTAIGAALRQEEVTL